MSKYYRTFPKTITDIAIYNASHVTKEILNAMLNTILDIRPDVNKVYTTDSFKYNSESILYILICPLGLIHEGHTKLPKYYIVYQLEGYIKLDMPQYLNMIKGALYTWDYSDRNIKKIKELYDIDSEYVCPGYTKGIPTDDIVNGTFEYTDTNRDIDVLFLGWDIHERRKAILEKLKSHGLNVLSVIDKDLNGMRDLIHKSKVCINIHYTENYILETVRLNVLLSNMSCIVSETSEDEYAIEIYRKSNIVWADGDKFIEEVVRLVSNFDERKHRAVSNYNWYSQNRKWGDIIDFDKLLPHVGVPLLQKDVQKNIPPLQKHVSYNNTCLVTGFFNISRMENNERDKSIQTYMKLSEKVLSIDHHMFIAIEPEYYDHVYKTREKYGLLNKTMILPINLQDMEYFQHYDTVVDNIKTNPYYNPNPKKDTALYTMVSYSKFNILELAMKFVSAKYYGWIDFGISHVADPFVLHLPTNEQINIMEIIHLYPDQVDTDEKLVNYCRLIKHDVAAGYFIGCKESMEWLCEEFRNIVNRALKLQVAPYEENVLAVIASNNPDKFRTYYGDFKGVLSNFNEPINCLDTIVKNILECRKLKDDDDRIHAIGMGVLNSYLSEKLESKPVSLLHIFNQLYISSWKLGYYGLCDRIVYETMRLILTMGEMAIEYDSNIELISKTMISAKGRGRFTWPLEHNESPCNNFLRLTTNKINLILGFYDGKL